MTAWWTGLELKHYPTEVLAVMIVKGIDDDGMSIGPGLRLSASRLWLKLGLDSDVAIEARKVIERAEMETR